MCILSKGFLHSSLRKKPYSKRERERERERERAPRKASGVDSATFFTWILSYFSGDMCILFERLRCAFPGKTDRGRSPRQASGIDFGILFTWILSYFSEEDCISFEKLLHFFQKNRYSKREIESEGDLLEKLLVLTLVHTSHGFCFYFS